MDASMAGGRVSMIDNMQKLWNGILSNQENVKEYMQYSLRAPRPVFMSGNPEISEAVSTDIITTQKHLIYVDL
jgi:hypothetical protein